MIRLKSDGSAPIGARAPRRRIASDAGDGHCRDVIAGASRPEISPVERFTLSRDDELARAYDALITAHGYANRSEAVRDLIHARLEARTTFQRQDGHRVASLASVHNHASRLLAERELRFRR
jgi:Arc/MetJ-type ribon-helix-helix transcriptional regulator